MHTRPLSLRTILLLTVSILTLLIVMMATREVYIEWKQLSKIQSLKQAVLFSDELFDATEKLSIERDIAFTMLHASDSDTIDRLRPNLKRSRQEVDGALSVALYTLKDYPFPELTPESGKSETAWQDIKALRLEIDQAIMLPKTQRPADLPARWFDQSSAAIAQTHGVWLGFIKHFIDVDPLVTLHMRFKYNLGVITEYTGRERSLIGRLIVENIDPSPDEQAKLLRWQGMVELAWKSCETLTEQSSLAPVIAPYLRDAHSHYLTVYDMVHDLFYIPGATHGDAYPIGAELWLELATQATDSLYALKDAALEKTQDYVGLLEAQAQRTIFWHATLLLFALLLCGFSFHAIIYRVLRPIHAMVEALLSATRGEPISFTQTAASSEDEIGKLSQVLSAFQQNMEKIRKTSVMLENYTRALERSNKELDDFAYIASHDLKEPLRGLFNHATFLLEDYKDKLDEDGVRKLHRLSYLAQRMEKLVNDLLYFSRLGRQELAIQPTDMNEVIDDIKNTLELFLEERQAVISVPATLPTLTCDKTRVTEAFLNLITNAVKYSDKPQKSVEIGCLPSRAAPDGTLLYDVFYVRDNGKGIPSEFYEEIFRIFKRLQSSKGNAEEGTGSGLTFVKKIVERHGGIIWPESDVGKGTTFYFTLKST